jgi:hypothetical protein
MHGLQANISFVGKTGPSERPGRKPNVAIPVAVAQKSTWRCRSLIKDYLARYPHLIRHTFELAILVMTYLGYYRLDVELQILLLPWVFLGK